MLAKSTGVDYISYLDIAVAAGNVLDFCEKEVEILRGGTGSVGDKEKFMVEIAGPLARGEGLVEGEGREIDAVVL